MVGRPMVCFGLVHWQLLLLPCQAGSAHSLGPGLLTPCRRVDMSKYQTLSEEQKAKIQVRTFRAACKCACTVAPCPALHGQSQEAQLLRGFLACAGPPWPHLTPHILPGTTAQAALERKAAEEAAAAGAALAPGELTTEAVEEFISIADGQVRFRFLRQILMQMG